MAVPAWPPGLRENALYGASSNQQMMTIPRASRLEADDFAFLRPTQSEAVLLQFGDLLAIRDNAVVAEWPVLSGQRDGAAPGPLT
jgi:D-serine deaminase-like pyridoxal phosphate-dependent protein